MALFLDILGLLALLLAIPAVIWIWWRSSAPKHTAPGEFAGDAPRGELKAGRRYYELARDSDALIRDLLTAERLSINVFPNDEMRDKARELTKRYDKL